MTNAKFLMVSGGLLILETEKGIVYNLYMSFSLIVICGALDDLDICLQKTVTFSLL